MISDDELVQKATSIIDSRRLSPCVQAGGVGSALVTHVHNEMSEWISKNRALLTEVWEITRASPQPDDIIAKLKASEFFH